MENTDLVKLKVLGLTNKEVQAGAYALLLETADNTPDAARRIPIVVGMAEAQSIAVALERIVPSRPLTHDLFISLFHVFRIEPVKVVINSFKDGVFAALLTVTNGEITVDIDTRTSDAIAIALRTGCPVYATPEVVALTSYEWRREDEEANSAKRHKAVRLEDLPVEKLEQRLQRYVAAEQYERAAKIQKIIVAKTNAPKE